MSNKKITDLSAIPSVDRTANVLEIVDVAGNTSYKVTPNNLLGFSGGNPVSTSDSQSLTNKTITAPTISSPVLSGTVTGTYTLGGTPTFPSTVVTLTAAQTLTNKILTSPTINTATIVNPTITADSIAGFSVSNTGTIYGVSVTTGFIASAALSNAVNTAAIQNAAVTVNKLFTGATTAVVLTSETTTSSTFTDLATSGPSVTVTIGANGLALVILSGQMSNNTSGDYSVMGFVASGANTIAASLDRSLFHQASATSNDMSGSWIYMATGLSSGSTTFKAQYEIITGGTGAFARRYITVVPL